MHGGFSDDNDNKPKRRDQVDTASIREKVKLARSEKWRILKNIGMVSLAFMVQFTAFQVSKNKTRLLSNEGENRLKQNQSTGNSKSPVINQR